jgi:hypothetical protein
MFPDPARARPPGVVSPEKSPHELHTGPIPPATKTSVMYGTEMRAHAARSRGENRNARAADR